MKTNAERHREAVRRGAEAIANAQCESVLQRHHVVDAAAAIDASGFFDELLDTEARLQGQTSAIQDDLRDLLEALALSTAARAKTPHQVMREAIDETRRLRRAFTDHLLEAHG